MGKINKKSKNYGLRVLAILAFGLIFVPFNISSAAYGTNINDNSTSGNSYNNTYSYIPVQSSQTQVYTPPPAPTPTVYSDSVNPNAVSSATTAKKTAAKTTTTNTNNNSGASLASNAIFGSNSFLPSGLVQWVIFAIIILLIVILTRKVFGMKEGYSKSPMKHD